MTQATIIPAYQRTPPAGHHNALAYRPACRQLGAQVVEGQVEWFVTLPSGQQYALGRTPIGPSTAQAHAALDAAGLCKTNGLIVPTLSPADAIAVVSARLEVTPVMMAAQPASNGSTLMVVAVGLGAIGYFFYRKYQHHIPKVQFLPGGDDGQQ